MRKKVDRRNRGRHENTLARPDPRIGDTGSTRFLSAPFLIQAVMRCTANGDAALAAELELALSECISFLVTARRLEPVPKVRDRAEQENRQC
jgi:hypothetical protein